MYNQKMKIIRLEQVNSTHTYLKEYILKNGFEESLCIFTDYQINGLGSRETLGVGKKAIYFSLL